MAKPQKYHQRGGRQANRGPPKPPTPLRRQLEFWVRQMEPKIARAKAHAKQKLQKIKDQEQINAMLQEWRRYFVPRHWNSPTKAVTPAYVYFAKAQLEYHIAETYVLEREIERLAAEHELATEMHDYRLANQIQHDFDRTLNAYRQVIQDAKIVAKQLQNFELPGQPKDKK